MCSLRGRPMGLDFIPSCLSSFFLSSSPMRFSSLSDIFLKNDMLAMRLGVLEDDRGSIVG